MASSDLDSPWPSSTVESFAGSFNIHIEEGNSADSISLLEVPTTSVCHNCNIPKPPPLPVKICSRTNYPRRFSEWCCVARETKDTWDKLFKEGYGADVYIITEDKTIVTAHSIVLVSKSHFPVHLLILF
uniref:Putative BTB/POZ and TAZ domain-containing protein 3 n=1 Tax=Davidia involucrata TaxID=16924 RepID=A0A5B7BPC5_DAVIN